jgi:CheY-like chemotaxis protein
MDRLNQIWLAEDNEADVRLMEEALHEHGLRYQLLVCRDGEEALRLADSAGIDDAPCPDLLILDLHLPKVDGPAVLRHFRANDNCRNTPVFVLSSSVSPKDRSYVEAFEGVSFVQKPMGLDEYLGVGRLVKDVLTLRAKAN